MKEHTPLYPVWVGRLVFPFRFGKLAAGLLIFVVMWVFLILGSRHDEIGFFAELFFAAMCAYLIPVFSLIVERSVATFDEIEVTLDASSEECARWRRGLMRRTKRVELALINHQLERVRPQRVTIVNDVESLDTVNRLLVYRRMNNLATQNQEYEKENKY